MFKAALSGRWDDYASVSCFITVIQGVSSLRCELVSYSISAHALHAYSSSVRISCTCSIAFPKCPPCRPPWIRPTTTRTGGCSRRSGGGCAGGRRRRRSRSEQRRRRRGSERPRAAKRPRGDASAGSDGNGRGDRATSAVAAAAAAAAAAAVVGLAGPFAPSSSGSSGCSSSRAPWPSTDDDSGRALLWW